jgi:hypothetical protein
MDGDRQKRQIVVLADGAGNAFTKQQSNIWRLQNALDLTQPDQIACYIPGVGTSGFKPWATVDAATGVGVPANVRKAYEFLCRNWREGDEIYMFGFSRGAFTIRTLIGMMHHEGLVATQSDDGELIPLPDLRAQIKAAWRSYRAKTAPFALRKMSPLIPAVRFLRVPARPVLAGARPSPRRARAWRPAPSPHRLRRPVRHGRGLRRALRGISQGDRLGGLADVVPQQRHRPERR